MDPHIKIPTESTGPKSHSATFFLWTLILVIFVSILGLVWASGNADRSGGVEESEKNISVTPRTKDDVSATYTLLPSRISVDTLENSALRMDDMTVESKEDVVDAQGILLHIVRFHSPQKLDVVTEYYARTLEQYGWTYAVNPISDTVQVLTGAHNKTQQISINNTAVKDGTIVGISYSEVSATSAPTE